MADLWCSLVEALRVVLVKFLLEIFSASFLCSVILVRSNTATMNRDEGAYQLSPIWTQVISIPKPGGGGGEWASTE